MQPMNDTGDQDCDPLLFPSKMRLSHTHCFGAWVLCRHAKTARTWQGMLPFYLYIGRLNVCLVASF